MVTEQMIHVIRDEKELLPAIKHALEDPSWYRDQRQHIVKEYVQFTDGCSINRLAQLIERLATAFRSA